MEDWFLCWAAESEDKTALFTLYLAPGSNSCRGVRNLEKSWFAAVRTDIKMHKEPAWLVTLLSMLEFARRSTFLPDLLRYATGPKHDSLDRNSNLHKRTPEPSRHDCPKMCKAHAEGPRTQDSPQDDPNQDLKTSQTPHQEISTPGS